MIFFYFFLFFDVTTLNVTAAMSFSSRITRFISFSKHCFLPKFVTASVDRPSNAVFKFSTFPRSLTKVEPNSCMEYGIV